MTSATTSACAATLGTSAILLGANAENCSPGSLGGTAAFTITALADDAPQVLIVEFTCPAGAPCLTFTQPATITVSADGDPLWSVNCDGSRNGCALLEQGQPPAVTLVAAPSTSHTLQVSVTPWVTWHIAGVRIHSQPLPTHIQGIAYSPYRDCQNPGWGPFANEQQIEEDLRAIRQMGNGIRTYASADISGHIALAASKMDMPVALGIWLGKDLQENEREITAALALVEQIPAEMISSIIVGNEVLLRGDMTEPQLLEYIERVRTELQTRDLTIPVTTAEIGAVLKLHPAVMDAVDLQMVHLYAYWDGMPIENAARHVVDQYHEIKAIAGGKPVVIGETGWPSAGPQRGSAVASRDNQRRFLREFLTLAAREDVAFYYFAAFDELWKTEGGVGPYWGVTDSGRRDKYDLRSVLLPLDENISPQLDMTPLPTGTPGPQVVNDPYFPVYTTYADEHNHYAPSGWMGDIGAISFNDCANPGPDWRDRVIEISYTPVPGGEGWAGIFWQDPENNWGDLQGGYDLSKFSVLCFQARSLTPGNPKVRFFVGGINTPPYPSSIPDNLLVAGSDADGYVALTEEWQTFVIPVGGADRSQVIDGFGWVTSSDRNPNGVTFQLDNIVYETDQCQQR